MTEQAEELKCFPSVWRMGSVAVYKNDSSHLLNLYYIYYM